MTLKAPHLTWRTRKRLKTAGLTLGILAAAALVLWLCWVIWLGRFVVYSRDAVRLDFDWQTPGEFVAAVPPEERSVNLLYDDGYEEVVERSPELARLNGFFVSADLLTGDLKEVERIIREQPKGTAIMLELKTGNGAFYYDTTLPGATVSSKIERKAVRELIRYLAKADYYLVAAVPAFKDRNFGLENTSLGILHSSGGYLWAGSDRCYWLDPAKNGTRSWLVSIAAELRDLGFDEILFTDFCFPPTDAILYEGDKLAALNETAQHLVYNLATEEFCISFLCAEEGFVLPEGRTRLYRNGVDASLLQSVVSTVTVPSTEINLVFLTETMDTRFDAYGVLRPLPTGVTTLPPATTPSEPTIPSGPPAEEP